MYPTGPLAKFIQIRLQNCGKKSLQNNTQKPLDFDVVLTFEFANVYKIILLMSSP